MSTYNRRFIATALAFVLLSALALTASASKKSQDIVDTAVSAGTFTTLVTAVEAAGLVDTLKSDGPFTVFAPNDEAFAKLPAGTVESLLEDKEKLAAILTYHVVAGEKRAADVVASSSLASVQGSELSVDTSDGPTIGGAKILATDIETSNGVIHVIDTVLIPE